MGINGSTWWVRLCSMGTCLAGVLTTLLTNFFHFAFRVSGALAVHLPSQRDAAG